MGDWSPPVDVLAATDHYAVLGIPPALGAGGNNVQRVMALSAVTPIVVKNCYHNMMEMDEVSKNPAAVSKVSQAFSILSSPDARKKYDLELMFAAASVS